MKKYDVTLTAHYEKTISVYADTPKQAKEKTETVLFDTDLIDFSDDDFVCGEATINDSDEENDESLADDCCSGCAYCCPVCGNCLCEDED